tara:strand:- start:3069 stop:3293 length:225 start_codon:yes stop_codon:yes gene_type:complete
MSRNLYSKILKEQGEKAAKMYWAVKKKKERKDQLEKNYPYDAPIYSKGQTASQEGGSYIQPKKKEKYHTRKAGE